MLERATPPRESAPSPTESIDVRAVALAGALIVAGIVASVLAAFALLRAYAPTSASGNAAAPGAPPAIVNAPRLEPDPAQEIAAYRAEKRKQLETYGWVDRERGIVHLPIERAMALVADPAPTELAP